MGTKSREVIYGSTIRYSAERAKEARRVADRLAVKAWNDRMLGYQGPAQPSPTIGDALNATLRSGASAATRTRPSPSTSCVGRRPHRLMSWSGTCAAGLLSGSPLSLQAEPSGRAATDEDIGERPAVLVDESDAVYLVTGIGFSLLPKHEEPRR
jgi:hypothetical protein